MADQDFFSTNVPAFNPKPGHAPESTDSFAKAIQSRFGPSSLAFPPPLHPPPTTGSKKKSNKHGFSLSMPPPALSSPAPPPVASSSASLSTIPTHSPSSSQLLCSPLPPSDLDQFLDDPECLILDIRSHAAFTSARLTNALSLSVPSTLLKRPLYSLEKLALMLSSKSARTRFSTWTQASSILVYDADSFHIPEGSNLYGLLKKFRNEGYPPERHLAWLKGGFVSVWRERKDLVVSGPDKAQVEEDEEDDTLEPLSPSQSAGLLRASALPSSAFNLSSTTSHRPSRAPQHSPTQPTLLLPAARIHSSTAKSAPQTPPLQSQAVAFNPFYDTVRQNLELSQGIPERIPLTLPASVRERITDLPFSWLRHIARRAAPASRDYTPLDCSAENTEEDTSSSSAYSSSSSSAGDSDPDTTPPLFSSGAPHQPPEDLIEQGTEALAMQFYRIELGEQRRLMGIMQHHSSESGRVLTSSSSGSPSSEEGLGALVPRVRHHKSRLNRTEVSFPYSITAGVEKGAKNRYRHIWPFEHARVRLLRSSSDDYINASFVQPLGTYKRYIATQGPLEATVPDFWTLVWEQNVHVIIMLTREVEGQLVKCCNYWDSGKYGPYSVKMVQTTETADERRSRQTQPTGFSWNSGPSSPPPGSKNPTVMRRLELSNEEFPSAGTRSIVQMQYLEWPDLNVPDDPRGILDLVTNLQQEVDSIPFTKATVDNLQPDEADPHTGIVRRGLDHPPVLLHCSAGVGRTGGFIAIDAILDGVRREVRKRRAAALRRKEERRNRETHESSQSPPFGIDRDVEMSDSKPSPLQESMVLDEVTDSRLLRTADRSLVMPIHATPHGSGEPLFHVPVAGWVPEDGSGGSSGERDQSSGEMSSQRDSPSPSEQMDIDEKEHSRSKLRRQKLEQTSPRTTTRRELKEWSTSDDSDRSNHLVRPHPKRMLSDESDIHQAPSDRSFSSGNYRLALASGSATGSSSCSDLNPSSRPRKSTVTQQSESQMTDVSTCGIRKLSPPVSIGSSSDSNYQARSTSASGTLSSSPGPPPPSTYPSPSPKRPHQRHRPSDEIAGRLSSPLGSSEDYSADVLSAFGLANQGETTATSSLPSSHRRTSDEGSASMKDRQPSSRASSDRESGTRHEVDNVSISPPSETIKNIHPRPFDYADPRAIFVDDEDTPPLLTTFGEPIRRILEDMREQRMSLCQSLRQYVFVHRAIIEGSLMIVDEEREREKEGKFTRQYEDPHVPPKRPSLSEIRHASFTEKAPAPKDMLSATHPVQFISNPLLTAASSVSISSSDHPPTGFFMPVRSAKRNASPTELMKEDATGDPELSKRPGSKRRHTEDVKERPTRAGAPVSPVRATTFFPHSASHNSSSTR